MQASTSAAVNTAKPCLEANYVKIVGESVGVTSVTPAGQNLLAEQLTLLLKRVINSSERFARHGRRLRVSCDDVEQACLEMAIQPPLGYSFRRVITLRQVPNPHGEDLFVRDDNEVELASVVADQQPPKIPLQPHIRAHWLAYDGVQPPLVENPRVRKEEDEEELLSSVPAVKSAGAGAGTNKAAPIAARRLTGGGSNASGAAVSFRAAARGVSTREQIQIKPNYAETMSVEQQLYLKEVVEACVGQDDKRRIDALQSLELDTGIQSLLPRLSNMIREAIRYNVVQRCLSILIYLVRIIRAIALNKSLRLEPVLHELVPALVSCMVSRQLCLRPETDNHWALRDFASKTLVTVIREDGSPTTRERVVRTVRKVFEDAKSSFPQIYGTVLIITEFGTMQEKCDVYPRWMQLMQATHPQETHKMTPTERAESQKLYAMLAKFDAGMQKTLARMHADY